MAAGAQPAWSSSSGIEKAVDAAVPRPSRTHAQKRAAAPRTSPRVAAISAGDEQIGQLIADAMEKVSARTASSPSRSPRPPRPTAEVVEGMQFDRGYISPYMVTDTEKMEAVMDDAYILHHRQEDLHHRRTSCPCWSSWSRPARSCVIIAEDVEGEALTTLIVNRLRGTLNVVRVEGPRLRRPPQGDAAGYRHPHRRHRSSPRSWAWSCKDATIDHAGPRPPGEGHQGEHHHRGRRRRSRGHQGPREPDPRPD